MPPGSLAFMSIQNFSSTEGLERLDYLPAFSPIENFQAVPDTISSYRLTTAHRDSTASRTQSRPSCLVVGWQGRLEAGARIRSTGRRRRGFVGSRLFTPQGRRPEQRRVLVQPGRQASVPGAARFGMAQHRESFAE